MISADQIRKVKVALHLLFPLTESDVLEDALQVALEALVRLESFDSLQNPVGWAFVVAKRAVFREASHSNRQSTLDSSSKDMILGNDAAITNFEESDYLESVFAQLRQADRHILMEHFSLGKSLKEISDETGLKLKTLKQRLTRARVHFRQAAAPPTHTRSKRQ